METKDKILEAALELFREKGFVETTMREIATGAGVATGLAYYYFPKKEDLVMAFYARAQHDLQPRLESAVAAHRKIEPRLRALIETKLDYFAPNRKFLGALMSYSADPAHRLSPFSAETAEIRRADMAHYVKAVEESEIKVPEDLKASLPGILWMYQMGLVLFWLYDRSEDMGRTRLLVEKSLRMVTLLMKAASWPLMRPARKMVLELVEIIETKA